MTRIDIPKGGELEKQRAWWEEARLPHIAGNFLADITSRNSSFPLRGVLNIGENDHNNVASIIIPAFPLETLYDLAGPINYFKRMAGSEILEELTDIYLEQNVNKFLAHENNRLGSTFAKACQTLFPDGNLETDSLAVYPVSANYGYPLGLKITEKPDSATESGIDAGIQLINQVNGSTLGIFISPLNFDRWLREVKVLLAV